MSQVGGCQPSREIRRPSLEKSERAILAQAVVEKKSDVGLLIATDCGTTAAIAETIDRLGGSIRYQSDELGYLRARLPTGHAQKVADHSGVVAVDFDNERYRWTGDARQEDQPRQSESKPASRMPGPDSSTRPEEGHLPLHRMHVPAFFSNHPKFDGRGVVVAVVDTTLDPLLPELQTALDLQGKSIPKFLDFLTALDPRDDASIAWIEMKDRVEAVNGQAVYRGLEYRTPADGVYRIGLLEARAFTRLLSAPPDVSAADRDGKKQMLAVLADEGLETVRVDVDGDRDLREERALRNYPVAFDVGLFGTDDPTTPLRESVAFTVQVDAQQEFVAVNVLGDTHATMVASTVAAESYFGGALRGVAPAAQILSVSIADAAASGQPIARPERYIIAAAYPKVDVIQSASGLHSLVNDGTRVLDLILDRLIERYRTTFVTSVGNTPPSLNAADSPAGSNHAIGVGAYIPKETWRANLGVDVRRDEYLASYSSRGPSEDGAMNVDVVAPTKAVAGAPRMKTTDNRVTPYALPAGYMVGGGTSQSSPFVSGAVALLISAAKQNGLPYDPWRLKKALAAGARLIPGYGVHEQGNGLIEVDAAWEALKTMKANPVRVDVRAPVNTVLSYRLATPHVGRGLYEREGWRVGQSGTRAMTLTRKTGPSAPIRYNLRWKGGDGTFTAQDSVVLPLNVPVDVNVNIHPTSMGVHSAILELVEPASGEAVFQTLTTIVAAERFDESNQFRVVRPGTADAPDHASFFYYVPPGTAALTLDLEVIRGAAKMQTHGPAGYLSNSAEDTYPRAKWQRGGQSRRSLAWPEPGVWEVTVEADQHLLQDVASPPSRMVPVEFTLSASIYGVDVTRSTDSAGAISVRNRLAPFTGHAVGSGLASVRRETVTLSSDRRQHIVDLEVPPGTDSLSVRIQQPSDTTADVDLYLFKCDAGACTRRAHSNRQGSVESVSFANPDAATWKIVIDLARVPTSGRVEVRYVDLMVHSLLGRTHVTDAAKPRPTGASWTAEIAAEVDAVPRNNRELVGLVNVVADGITRVVMSRKPNVQGLVDVTDERWYPVALGRVEIPVTPDVLKPARQ